MKQLFLALWLTVAASFSASPVFAQALVSAGSQRAPADFSIAFYYSADIPWEALGAFDVAVVDPGHVSESMWHHRLNPRTQVAAYISVGEVHPTRSYFGAVDKTWQLGLNTDWGSVVVDQTSAAWRAFFVSTVVTPLWRAGYRSFFLDTLDSFHLVAKTPQGKADQARGLAQLVRDIKRAHPEAKLIFNRGFEILPEVNALAWAVAAESLFQGYDAGKKAFRAVPQADRDWLWGQLKRCKDEYRLPVISIDYVPPTQRQLALDTAKKIRALGAIAWVATPELDSIGVGNVELLPRQVLALHDETGHLAQLATHEMHRLGELPLNALGMDASLVAVGSPELARHTQRPLRGRFAGVVMWFSQGGFPKDPNVLKVFNRAREEGVPVVMVGSLPEDAAFEPFDVDVGKVVRLGEALKIEKLSPHVGFEVMPSPIQRELSPTTLRNPTAPGTEVWLRVRSANQVYSDAIAITPWGGFAAERFWKLELPQNKGSRWAVNPIAFFGRALQVDLRLPVPDVTSENATRFLITHVDGDGFASRAEVPGTPLASEVMLKDFLERYRLPTTVSIIQGEVGATGLYKALSPQLEGIAKRIFALPHVEIATHTFSHPFFWAEAELGLARDNRPVGLNIAGYTFDARTEIAGSAEYINTRLAPPGKRTRMLLWSGDTQPLAAPVREAYRAGLLNMNGGYTVISRLESSLSLVGPLGMMKGEHYQVYAPNQNENVYTNNWLGPFYGFERVIETFEMTERPQRLKPVNIYYHTYIASKAASIASLHRVYGWALKQDLNPIFASEYALRVLDWRRATVSRLVGGDAVAGELELRSGGEHLRQWRVSATPDAPVFARTLRQDGWAGQSRVGDSLYLNAIESVATTSMNPVTKSIFDAKNASAVTLKSANGRVAAWATQVQPGEPLVRVTLASALALRAQFESACVADLGLSSKGLAIRRTANQWDVTQSMLEGAHDGSKDIVFRCPR